MPRKGRTNRCQWLNRHLSRWAQQTAVVTGVAKLAEVAVGWYYYYSSETSLYKEYGCSGVPPMTVCDGANSSFHVNSSWTPAQVVEYQVDTYVEDWLGAKDSSHLTSGMVMGAPVASIDARLVGVWDVFLVPVIIYSSKVLVSITVDMISGCIEACKKDEEENDDSSMAATDGSGDDEELVRAGYVALPDGEEAEKGDLTMILPIAQRRALSVTIFPILPATYLVLYPIFAMRTSKELDCPFDYFEVLGSQGSSDSCTWPTELKILASALSAPWAMVIAGYSTTLTVNLLYMYGNALFRKLQSICSPDAYNDFLKGLKRTHDDPPKGNTRNLIWEEFINPLVHVSTATFSLAALPLFINGLTNSRQAAEQLMCTQDLPRMIFAGWVHGGNGEMLKDFPFPPPDSGVVASLPFNSSAVSEWANYNATAGIDYHDFMSLLNQLKQNITDPSIDRVLEVLGEDAAAGYGIFTHFYNNIASLFPELNGGHISTIMYKCFSVVVKEGRAFFNFDKEKLFEMLPACDKTKQALISMGFTLGFEITAVNLSLLAGLGAALFFGARALCRDFKFKTDDERLVRVKELRRRRDHFTKNFIAPAQKWGGIGFASLMLTGIVCYAAPVYLEQINPDDCSPLAYFMPLNQCSNDETLARTSIVAPIPWLLATFGFSTGFSVKVIQRLINFAVRKIKEKLGSNEQDVVILVNDAGEGHINLKFKTVDPDGKVEEVCTERLDLIPDDAMGGTTTAPPDDPLAVTRVPTRSATRRLDATSSVGSAVTLWREPALRRRAVGSGHDVSMGHVGAPVTTV